MLNNDLIIWCTCHNKNIAKEYNLYNSKHFKMYNNYIENFNEYNINNLHDYLREICTYYYVWKNKIKSDYVGFCQYSKHFSHIDYNILNNFGFYSYEGCLFNSLDYLYNDSSSYSFFNRNMILYLKFKYDIDLYSDFYSKNCINMFSGGHNMYVFTWDMFNDVCDFIFGFLDYIYPNWNTLESIIFLSNMFCNDNVFDKESYYKLVGFGLFFEWWVGVYLGIKSKYNERLNTPNNIDNFFYINNDRIKRNKYSIFCNYEINNEYDLIKLKTFIKQNIKSGIINYYFRTKYDLEYLYKYYCGILNRCVYNIKTFNNIYDYMQIKNNLLSKNYNVIELNINERIHCDTSLEMYKGNYYIEEY